MAQEFTIKSPTIEDKINQLLPSQGGQGAGVDFSASTMVVPIVDLTESAEGSNLRQDLQTAFSHNNTTAFSVNATTSTLVITTGYYRIIGSMNFITGGALTGYNGFQLNDGTTDKNVFGYTLGGSSTNVQEVSNYDFIVKLDAGDSLKAVSAVSTVTLTGSLRQIADINGNLT